MLIIYKVLLYKQLINTTIIMKNYHPNTINLAIDLAWSDKVSFDEIYDKTGFSESHIIKIMRNSLKASSFKVWRKRVSGRKSKHRKLNRF